jgi:hypothetical protein
VNCASIIALSDQFLKYSVDWCNERRGFEPGEKVAKQNYSCKHKIM